uniref:Uncharacterized protein n=1 Tax=Arundo donax TaxID=35708 RepID=A0A0A9GG25_ARUDO
MSVLRSSTSPAHPSGPGDAAADHSPDGDTAGLKSATPRGVSQRVRPVGRCVEYTAAQLRRGASAGTTVETYTRWAPSGVSDGRSLSATGSHGSSGVRGAGATTSSASRREAPAPAAGTGDM